MLRKLGSYPRQNGLAVALPRAGPDRSTPFILDWLQSVELRRRVHAGLNKGEARNSLARAVFFNRLWGNQGSELRAAALPDRPQPGDGGYRAVEHGVPGTRHPGLVEAGKPVDGELLQFCRRWLEHINLTGDYVWRQSRRLEDGKFRPLRMPGKTLAYDFSEFCGLP